jgi:hypothetical protein
LKVNVLPVVIIFSQSIEVDDASTFDYLIEVDLYPKIVDLLEENRS